MPGSQTLNATGQPLRLLRLRRAGTKHVWIEGWRICAGPADTATVQAIAAWHANGVRVPLNEPCWLSP